MKEHIDCRAGSNCGYAYSVVFAAIEEPNESAMAFKSFFKKELAKSSPDVVTDKLAEWTENVEDSCQSQNSGSGSKENSGEGSIGDRLKNY